MAVQKVKLKPADLLLYMGNKSKFLALFLLLSHVIYIYIYIIGVVGFFQNLGMQLGFFCTVPLPFPWNNIWKAISWVPFNFFLLVGAFMRQSRALENVEMKKNNNSNKYTKIIELSFCLFP